MIGSPANVDEDMVDKDIVYSPVLSDRTQLHPWTEGHPLLLQQIFITQSIPLLTLGPIHSN